MLSDLILREAQYLRAWKPLRYELTTSQHEASGYYEGSMEQRNFSSRTALPTPTMAQLGEEI